MNTLSKRIALFLTNLSGGEGKNAYCDCAVEKHPVYNEEFDMRLPSSQCISMYKGRVWLNPWKEKKKCYMTNAHFEMSYCMTYKGPTNKIERTFLKETRVYWFGKRNTNKGRIILHGKGETEEDRFFISNPFEELKEFGKKESGKQFLLPREAC